MARSLRDLRRKMKAIKSTRQVTKAMELVAGSKMRKAVQNAVQLRRYASTAALILERMAEVHPELHPYLTERPARKILALLFTSDRGLCGSLNAQLFRSVREYIRSLEKLPEFESLEFAAIGRKGQQFLSRMVRPRIHSGGEEEKRRGGEEASKIRVVAAFPAMSNHSTFRDALPVVRLATDGFLAGTYDQVVLLFPDFISALLQEPRVRVLLPFSPTDLKEMLASLLPRRRSGDNLPPTTYPSRLGRAETDHLPPVTEYLFEPSPDDILATILPQLTEVQVYQAILEAAASEHSARMVAMRNATDNANEILDDLTLTYNQTRQAGITAELAEISASKAALEA